MNKIVAVLVTYNPEIDVLIKNVHEIKKQANEIIVVDNNSINKGLFLPTLSKKCDTICFDSNLGLSKAQNEGLKRAKEMKATHIVIFDQDSVINDSFIEEQIKCETELLNRGIKVAGVGPAFFDRDSGYTYPATVYKGPLLHRVVLENSPVQSTFIIASGSLIRMSVLEHIGLMREDFFIDFVDVEWSIRANSMGYSSFINPKVKMEHSIGDRRVKVLGRVISLHSDFRKYYISRNALFMARLSYVPAGYKIRVVFFNLIRSMLGIALSDKKIKTVKCLIKGWCEGLGHFEKNKKWSLNDSE